MLNTPMKTLADALGHHAAATPAAPFVTHLASDTTITYGAGLDAALRLSALLAEVGVGSRARVVFGAKNHWLVYPLLVACAARGATLVPVDPDLHRDELAFVLSHASPALTISADRSPLPASPGDGSAARLSLSEVLRSLEARTVGLPDLRHGEPSDVVLMIYTSGTTSSGKSVMLTQANLLANATSLARRYALGTRDRLLCTLPTHHMNALMLTGITPLVAGAHVYLSDPLSVKNAKRYWNTISERHVTICSMVPSIMALLLKLFPRGPSAPLDDVRFGFCGAAPLRAELWKRFEEVFRFPVYQGYGLTETTCWAVSTPMDGPRRYDTVGTVMDCEVRIDSAPAAAVEAFLFDKGQPEQQSPQSDLTPLARECGMERTGEILIRGPIVSAGYYKNRKLTEQTTTEDGFFRTGDLGFFDADGFLNVNGRLKEIIIRNGVNIFSRDIDETLRQHASVKDCKTIGVPDNLVGERICAVCVVEDEAAVTEQELRTWVQERLSQQMWPDATVIMGYLPSGAAGKVSINVLRKIIAGEMTETIISSVNSWKYKRAQPSSLEQMRRNVTRSLMRGEPIRFLSYWGCGKRGAISDVDRAALRRLNEFIDGMRRVPQAPPMLTLIFTDTHAANNRIPRDRADSYFADIQSVAIDLGMDTVRLSELWAQGGLTPRVIAEEAEDTTFEAPWQALPLRARLIEQARRHVEQGGDPEAAAKRYYLGCSQESVLIAERYATFMFLTYNHPDFDFLLPDLPKIYLSSFKAGTSAKPWFIDDM
jgi:acyl-CoA synthetase (AMP-forming)/AMP-acid ligase II